MRRRDWKRRDILGRPDVSIAAHLWSAFRSKTLYNSSVGDCAAKELTAQWAVWKLCGRRFLVRALAETMLQWRSGET